MRSLRSVPQLLKEASPLTISTLLSMTFPEISPRGEQYLLGIPHDSFIVLLECPETYNLKLCSEYITALLRKSRDGLSVSF